MNWMCAQEEIESRLIPEYVEDPLTWGIFWKMNSKGMSRKSRLEKQEVDSFYLDQFSNTGEYLCLGLGVSNKPTRSSLLQWCSFSEDVEGWVISKEGLEPFLLPLSLSLVFSSWFIEGAGGSSCLSSCHSTKRESPFKIEVPVIKICFSLNMSLNFKRAKRQGGICSILKPRDQKSRSCIVDKHQLL